MDDEIYLVSNSGTRNSFGAFVADRKTEPRRVLCTVSGITRSEWAAAGQLGHKPSLVATVPVIDYQGEQEAIFHENRYSIYRTHPTKDGWDVELYLEARTGVTYEHQTG